MNINVLQTSNPYTNGLATSNRSKKAVANTEEIKLPTQKDISITNKELKYFQQLFPENAAQIEKYVSFNRNGQATQISIPKGTLVNARV
ncbi:MAG: hypothetical protein LBO69_04145 [Ignavibacteria bacterium]|jgi:ribonucleotide reductase beta subunit family protein with ferritin-like domain|nr:hypothetical protein [Ignavibacteria bacterium]